MGTRLLVTIAAAGFSVVATACGSSTAPLTNPATLAARFDSLGNALFCSSGGGGANMNECTLIEAAHMGVAEGVQPTQIRVTTSAGSANWLGYVYLYRYAGRVAGSIDSVYGVVAYDGVDFKSAVETYVPVNWGGFSYALIDSTWWSTQGDAQSGTGTATVLSIGNQCALVDTYGPYRPPINQQDCRYASIRLSVEVTFRTFSGNDSTTISIPSQTMNGFVLDTGAIYMRSHDAMISGKVR